MFRAHNISKPNSLPDDHNRTPVPNLFKIRSETRKSERWSDIICPLYVNYTQLVSGTHTKASEYNHVDVRWENNANQKVLSVTFIISTVTPRSTTQGFVLCVALTNTFHKATWNHCHNNHDPTSNHNICTYSKTCTVVRLWCWGAGRPTGAAHLYSLPAIVNQCLASVLCCHRELSQDRNVGVCVQAWELDLRTWEVPCK